MAKTIARKSVPLTGEELRAVNELLRGDSERSAALRGAAGLRGTEHSEAAVLHALVDHGFRRVREEADDRGYAALVQSYAHPMSRSTAASPRLGVSAALSAGTTLPTGTPSDLSAGIEGCRIHPAGRGREVLPGGVEQP